MKMKGLNYMTCVVTREVHDRSADYPDITEKLLQNLNLRLEKTGVSMPSINEYAEDK